ncbi:SusD/RagB family nutrient-binding outer membrane lipoprotein [Mucilaginibacter sp. UR6-1]|uniref:SusD/RagB family nutrient-binding outer membrane lipoprotein n=1 Tax=Mucilaginibacter sp. UR6-1 TaxID=1435643 RepID=UPI001E33AEDA|nr:SusD/RagB family nutrient-binding outer membrane lipoprotein [Mucilaginibacter sp. UR6-1]MCC8407565.1 SusD/RagB family nutrient-binding outer membrane lipoprotein [Mucilaginibacter sp. UR6-1]
MKKKYIIWGVALSLSLFSASCTRNFQEINTDPNSSSFALPQSLLAPAITDVVSANMSRSQRITNELMQITVNMGDTDGKIFRYEVRAAEADYLWNAWYLQLTNFKDIYTGGKDNLSNTYMAISLICQSWVYSMLTDTYGDVPYFQSNRAKEGLFLPKFDTQQAIYADIFARLEEANELLKTGTNVVSTSDPIFGGNATYWRKFGNSLYLRLLMRVSNKDQAAIDKIKDMVDVNATNYPIMTSNAESAILKWSGTAPYVSPFSTWRPADWYTPKLASFFVDNLNEWSDPRIGKWATVFEGEYAGIPSGYPVGQVPVAKSTLPTALQKEPLLGNVLNYAEVQFILAEAAAKGWITSKPAQQYYQEGITGAITMWGYTVPANYMNYSLIKWDDSYTLDQKMELIHKQKYYALFFTDMQSWFEYRRTGHPVLPKGSGLDNGGVMPARLNYPVYVQAANSENYRAAVAAQGQDVISTQVWWQKP